MISRMNTNDLLVHKCRHYTTQKSLHSAWLRLWRAALLSIRVLFLLHKRKPADRTRPIDLEPALDAVPVERVVARQARGLAAHNELFSAYDALWMCILLLFAANSNQCLAG